METINVILSFQYNYSYGVYGRCQLYIIYKTSPLLNIYKYQCLLYSSLFAYIPLQWDWERLMMS